jgi:hypothetical protein
MRGWELLRGAEKLFTMGPPKLNTILLTIAPPVVVGRPNQYPNLDRLSRASLPIPILWSNSTIFRNRPTSGWFRMPDPRRVAISDHGYECNFNVTLGVNKPFQSNKLLEDKPNYSKLFLLLVGCRHDEDIVCVWSHYLSITCLIPSRQHVN